MTSFAFDAVGNLTSLTDPVNNTTTWTYDALDRATQETNTLGAARTWVYDAASNVTQYTDRNGRITEYVYDELHRPTQETWLASDGITVVNTIDTTYDAVGRVTNISDGDSAYFYVYDNLGRLLHADNLGTPGVPNVVLRSMYDLAGNRTWLGAEIDFSDDFENEYTYDALHRLTRIEQSEQVGGNPVSEKRVDLAYNAAGEYTTISRYEDLAGTQLVATSTYTHDAAGRLTGLTHAKGANTLADYAWAYDAADRVTQFTSADGTTDYSYDTTDQLTAADHSYQGDEGWTYDPNGNRTNGGYTVGTNNRLLSDGTYSYQYDAEGNRTRKTEIATGDYVDYGWDHRNRLTTVSFRTNGGTLTKQVQYTYDVHDRLIRKEVDDNGDGLIDRSESLVYDGGAVVVIFDETGSFKNRYLHGDLVDQVFLEESVGEILWGLGDNQGTIRDVANYDPTLDESAVLNHRQFDAFGGITSESDPNVNYRYAYTGRYFDEDTGIQYNRARWYDAATGRWMSEDPIGFDGGDANLNRYVGNSPANYTDPSGLAPPWYKRWWWKFGGRSGDGTDKRTDVTNGLARGVLDSAFMGQFGKFQDKAAGGKFRHHEGAAKAAETVYDILSLKGGGKKVAKEALEMSAKKGGRKAAVKRAAKSQDELRKEAAEALAKRNAEAASTVGKCPVDPDIAVKIKQFGKKSLKDQQSTYKNLKKTYEEHLKKYGQSPGKTTGETNRMERELDQMRRILEGRGRNFDSAGNILN